MTSLLSAGHNSLVALGCLRKQDGPQEIELIMTTMSKYGMEREKREK